VIVENITLGEVWIWVAGILTAIILIGNAADKIGSVIKAVKAPNDDLKADVEELKEWRGKVDLKLNNDHTELKGIREGNQAIFQALLALLDHGIDGNNINQMEKAKEVVRNHLITH
jgi:hypothetical protein